MGGHLITDFYRTPHGQGYRHGLESAIEQIDNYELPDFEALIRKIELLADDERRSQPPPQPAPGQRTLFDTNHEEK